MKKLVFAVALCTSGLLSAQSFKTLATDQTGDDFVQNMDVTEFASALSPNQDSIFFKITHNTARPADFGYMIALDTNSNPADGKAINQTNLYGGNPNNSMKYDLLIFVYQNSWFPPAILEAYDDSGMPTTLNFKIDTADDYSLTMKFALADIGGDEAMNIIAGVGSFDISGSGPSDIIPNSNYVELVNGTTLGISASSHQVGFYPNPAKDYVMVNEKASVAIYDISGALKLQVEANLGDRIDISQLPAGCYTISADGKSAKLLKL